MIKTEEKVYGSRTLKRTYSDEGFKIRQIETDTIYAEAIDVLEANYTYEETNELIEVEEPVEEPPL